MRTNGPVKNGRAIKGLGRREGMTRFLAQPELWGIWGTWTMRWLKSAGLTIESAGRRARPSARRATQLMIVRRPSDVSLGGVCEAQVSFAASLSFPECDGPTLVATTRIYLSTTGRATTFCNSSFSASFAVSGRRVDVQPLSIVRAANTLAPHTRTRNIVIQPCLLSPSTRAH